MDLRYSHQAELLHSLFVSMVTVFPWQQSLSMNTHGHKEQIVPNIKFKYFPVADLLQQSFVVMVTVVTMATR